MKHIPLYCLVCFSVFNYVKSFDRKWLRGFCSLISCRIGRRAKLSLEVVAMYTSTHTDRHTHSSKPDHQLRSVGVYWDRERQAVAWTSSIFKWVVWLFNFKNETRNPQTNAHPPMNMAGRRITGPIFKHMHDTQPWQLYQRWYAHSCVRNEFPLSCCHWWYRGEMTYPNLPLCK